MASPGTDDNARTRLPGKPSWINIWYTKSRATIPDKARLIGCTRLRQRCNLDGAIRPRTRRKACVADCPNDSKK